MRILLVVALVLGVASPVAVSDSMFNDAAFLDISQVAFIPEPAICTSDDPDAPEDDVCAPRNGREDWDHAMAACLNAHFTKWECYAAMNDGEF